MSLTLYQFKIKKMKLTKIIILTVILSFFGSMNANAQDKGSSISKTKEYLKGLTKASQSDLIGKDIKLDGESIPIYNIEGKRIKGEEIMETFMSGKYTPDFYMDEKKEIKVAVLRLITKKEKEMMQKMQANTSGKSELVGTNSPVFSATDINGNKYSLNSLKGKIIVMNFWFVECKPCVMEIPELNKLVEKYKNKNVVFLGFALNDKSEIDIFLKKKNFNYNLIPKSSEIAAKYKVSSYPSHIIIDGNSKIVYVTSGLSSTTVGGIDKTIENLIKK